MTREWIEKAEGDYAIACREIRTRKKPSYDGVCYHAQQCAEKYLKARLHAAEIRFPKTHAIPTLIDLAMKLEPEWELLRNHAKTLTDYAVRFRYPGAFATKTQAREAVKLCEFFRERVRLALRLTDAARRKRISGTNRTKTVRKRRTKRSQT